MADEKNHDMTKFLKVASKLADMRETLSGAFSEAAAARAETKKAQFEGYGLEPRALVLAIQENWKNFDKQEEGGAHNDLVWGRHYGYTDAAYMQLKDGNPAAMQVLFMLQKGDREDIADAQNNLLHRMSLWASVMPADAKTLTQEIRRATVGLNEKQRAVLVEKTLPRLVESAEAYDVSPCFVAAMKNVIVRPQHPKETPKTRLS